MQEKIEFAKKIVYEAKDYILKEMDNIQISIKSGHNDFVTSMDRNIEKMLVTKIQEKFPNQTFLTEESMVENKVGNQSWIIDPIDGTTNFIYSQRYFAISLAYYEDGQPEFGIVYDVMADEMFLGIKDKGAYLNNRKLEYLDRKIDIPNILFSGSYSIFNDSKYTAQELNKNIIAHRYLGSAAIEICHIAAGRLHIYQAHSLNLYDIAAAVIVLNEVDGLWRFGEHYNKVQVKHQSGLFYACTNKNLFTFMEENIIERS